MGRVVAFGEVMVELALAGGGQAAVGYAGDTFNTAVYLQRLGVDCVYVTAIGAGDPFSAGVLELMRREGLATGLVAELPGRLPGLYAIERDADGERSFFYWRSEAAVRQYFADVGAGPLTEAVESADVFYLSAISLAVAGEAGRAALRAVAGRAKATALDLNYRPRLWPSAAAARAAITAFIAGCRLVSASEADLEALELTEGPAQWAAAGAEVILRREDRTVAVLGPGTSPTEVSAAAPVTAVDTTGAGDSFNAAYLAARLAGRSPAEAVAAGQALASAVVQHPGALIPRAAMPALD